MARGLFAVLEDEISEVVPASTEQEERIQELEEQVADAEIAEDQQEVTEMAEASDDAIAAIEELSEVADVIEDSVEEGEGLTEDAAEIAEVAVESICARLGYKPTKKVVPALEAFGATSSRLDASRYALEGISETVKNIWAAIKKFFATIWEKIKGFWNRLFDKATKLKAKADSLAKKVDEAIESKQEVDVVKKLNLTPYCQAFNAKVGSEITKNALEVFGSHTEVNKGLDATNKSIVKMLEQVAAAESLEDLTKLRPDLSQYDAQLAFGYTLKTNSSGNKLDLKEPATKSDSKIEGIAVEPKALKPIIKGAKDLVVEIEANKKNYASAEKVVKMGMALADRLSKTSELSKTIQDKAKMFRDSQSNFILVNTKLQSLSLNAAGAALKYVSANLGALKAAE